MPESACVSQAVRLSGVTAAAGVFAGFALLALVDACAIAVVVPLPSAGLGLRALHYVFDAAETLGVGALLALAIGAFVRFVPLPRWAMTGVTIAAAVVIAERLIGDNLVRIAAHALGGRFMWALYWAYLVFLGVGFAEVLRGAVLASWRPRLRFLPVVLVVGLLAANQAFVPDDYAAIHCVVAWGAAMLAGAALAPLAERAGRALVGSRSGRSVLGATALFAAFGIAWPPSNATRFELFRQPCAIAPWVLAATVWRAPRLPEAVRPPASPWDEDRSTAAPVPPSAPPLLPPGAVVVLLTVDAVRADAVDDPRTTRSSRRSPALKRDGVVFAHASAPGAQTASSLSTLFSGRYFSERRWATTASGHALPLPRRRPGPLLPRAPLPARRRDGKLRGPLLSRRRLRRPRRLSRGEVFVAGRRHAKAAELIEPLLDRLRHADGGPLFLYTHLLDAHAPYNRGGKSGTDYERYLAEVAIADTAVGQVAQLLEADFGTRWALFVSADHGEAFGEHQSYDHAKTLYEELLHVPLLARSPRFAGANDRHPRGADRSGPTILDLFGVATPATFNGQSLVPILAGGSRRSRARCSPRGACGRRSRRPTGSR